MKAIAAGAFDPTQMITHRLGLHEMERGYNIFKNASDTNALKVVLSAR